MSEIEGEWAPNVGRLHVEGTRQDKAFNVEGRRVAGPQQGFGRLYDRTFTIVLGDVVTPEALVREWRARFGDFWPKSATFYGSITSIKAGDVAPLTASGITTGVLVIYADDTSFSYMTPEGHMFAGMITFSARHEQAGTVAEIRMLVRPADAFWVMVWPVGRGMEGKFWKGTLTNLAASRGVTGVTATETTTCVDQRILWKNWRNVFRNGAAATALHDMRAPFRKRPVAR
jgi:Domain of unknown function (DUF1990)